MEAERPLARGTAHPLWPLFVLALGAGVLALVLAHPAVDESWENHPAHFWLVLTAAAINVALGYVVGVEARLRRDGNDQRQLTHPVLRPRRVPTATRPPRGRPTARGSSTARRCGATASCS